MSDKKRPHSEHHKNNTFSNDEEWLSSSNEDKIINSQLTNNEEIIANKNEFQVPDSDDKLNEEDSFDLFSDEELNQIISTQQQTLSQTPEEEHFSVSQEDDLFAHSNDSLVPSLSAVATASSLSSMPLPEVLLGDELIGIPEELSPATSNEIVIPEGANTSNKTTTSEGHLYHVDSPKEEMILPHQKKVKKEIAPFKLGTLDKQSQQNDEELSSSSAPKDVSHPVGRVIKPHAGSVQSFSFKKTEQQTLKKYSIKLIGSVIGGILLFILLIILFWPPPSVEDLLKNENYQEALPILIKSQRWGEVGYAYAKLGHNKKAISAYSKAHLWMDAARLCLIEKRLRDAADYFFKAHAWKKAADTFIKIRDFAAAAPLYERLRDYGNAIDAYEKSRHWKKVAQLNEKISEFKEAAKFYVKAQMWEQAAKLNQKLKQWQKAALFFNRAKMPLQEAQSLLAWGKMKSAKKIFDQLSMFSCSGAILQHQQKFKKAAISYQKASKLGENYNLLTLAVSSFERARRYRSSRRNLKKNLSLALKYKQYFIAFKLYEQLGKRRSGLRKLRRNVKAFLKMDEPWLANLIVRPLLFSNELVFAEKIPFTRLTRKLSKKLRKSPLIVSSSKKLIVNTKRKGEHYTNYKIHISAKLKLPYNGMILTPLYLSCYLFQKDLSSFVGRELDEQNYLDFCAKYRGSLASFRHFYKTDAGFFVSRKIGRFDDKQQQTLSFDIVVPVPYKKMICTLQHSPKMKIKKRKK